MFGRATITLGIGPHSSSSYFTLWLVPSRTSELILTINMSYDVLLHNNIASGGHNETAAHLQGQVPPKNPKDAFPLIIECACL